LCRGYTGKPYRSISFSKQSTSMFSTSTSRRMARRVATDQAAAQPGGFLFGYSSFVPLDGKLTFQACNPAHETCHIGGWLHGFAISAGRLGGRPLGKVVVFPAKNATMPERVSP
jgi:hypothetical protein